MPAIRVADPFTVDAVGNREPVVASGPCRYITIRQDPNETLAKYYVSDLESGGTPLEKWPGESHTFLSSSGLFQEGDIVGYVETASGSITMQQEEGL
jgi:hypothetical protein